jgi:hypothetical protein
MNKLPEIEVVAMRSISNRLDYYLLQMNDAKMLCKGTAYWPHYTKPRTLRLTFSNIYVKRSKQYRAIRERVLEKIAEFQGGI